MRFRHLLQSSGLDGMSDLSRDILDLADSDITDKVCLLFRGQETGIAAEDNVTRTTEPNRIRLCDCVCLGHTSGTARV